VHVLGAAEVTVKSGGQDDDGNLWAAATEVAGDLGAETAGPEVIVKHGDINVVEGFGGFLDGRGRNTAVPVLAKDRGTKVQIGRFVVQKEDANV
jgi:hypothetical protein